MQNSDDFTRDLNDRIRELEEMNNELENQAAEADDRTTELDDEATRAEDEGTNMANLARQEGDSIFFTATVDAESPLKLRVTNNNGDIHVTSGDTSQVEIRAERTKGEDADHTHWFFQQIDNDVTLRPNWQFGSHVSGLASKLKNQIREGFRSSEWSGKDFKFGFDVSYDLTVVIPRTLAADSQVWIKTANGDGFAADIDAMLDFKTANGDVQIEGAAHALTLHTANGDLQAKRVTGDVSAATANGDVRLHDVTGSVDSNTSNGDITLEGVTGSVTLRTANGDVRVSRATIMGGRIATVAGDIHAEGNFVNTGAFTFDTVSGDVHVNAKVPTAGARFSAKSLSGKIRAEGEWTNNGKNDWTLGEGGGPHFSAKSVSGPVTVSAEIDNELTLVESQPAPETSSAQGDGETSFKSGEVNINLDQEIERAKGWLKVLANKVTYIVDDKKEGETTEIDPVAPQVPQPPQPPVDPEAAAAAKSATASRRAELLERVKSGELTVDEALAQLEEDI